MIERTHGPTRLLHFESFEPLPNLRCAASLRGHDLAPVRGPDRGRRRDNWRAMASALGFGSVWAQLQVHEPGIVHVTTQALAAASQGDSAAPAVAVDVPPADACFTALAGVGLLAFSADCPLVAVCDPGEAVGVAHASWRCTANLIVGGLIERMVAELSCRPERMWCAVGPSAGPCCYEVGDDVFAAASALPRRDACFRRVDGKWHFDLWQAAVQQLTAAGVPPHRVQVSGLCTICRPDKFYSYRREGPNCGAFGLMIGQTTPNR